MSKKIIALLIIVLTIFSSLYAHSGSFDLALMVGSGSFKNPKDGISASYGVTVGITPYIDFSLVGISEIIPSIGKNNVFLFEATTTLMGKRNTGSSVSGINLNSLLSLGAFYSTIDKGGGLYLGLTPLAVGSPTLTRRERVLRTNVGWDFVNKKVFVTFSPIDIEVYLIGTYRDFIEN